MDQRLEFLTTGSCSSSKPQVVLELNHYFSQPYILPYYLKLILEGAHITNEDNIIHVCITVKIVEEYSKQQILVICVS